MIKVKFEDYQISWGYNKTNKSKMNIIENDEELLGNDKFLAKKKLVFEAVYKNIFNNYRFAVLCKHLWE